MSVGNTRNSLCKAQKDNEFGLTERELRVTKRKIKPKGVASMRQCQLLANCGGVHQRFQEWHNNLHCAMISSMLVWQIRYRVRVDRRRLVRRLLPGSGWEITVGVVSCWILKCFREKVWWLGCEAKSDQARVCGSSLYEDVGILWCDKGEQNRRTGWRSELTGFNKEAATPKLYDAPWWSCYSLEKEPGAASMALTFSWASSYLSLPRSWLNSSFPCG